MNPPLTDVEVRVLGALLEKEATTPDNYPLTLSGLVAACNQSSNREPVMQLDDERVTHAIVALRRRSLLRAIQPAGSRVTKYQHLLTEALMLEARERAVLGVLALRGPQTPGELHARTARLADFADLAQLEATIDGLVTRPGEPLVVPLPRRPGQKEVRFAHLLSGERTPDEAESAALAPTRESPTQSNDDRVAALECELADLRRDVATLRAQFDDFRSQF